MLIKRSFQTSVLRCQRNKQKNRYWMFKEYFYRYLLNSICTFCLETNIRISFVCNIHVCTSSNITQCDCQSKLFLYTHFFIFLHIFLFILVNIFFYQKSFFPISIVRKYFIYLSHFEEMLIIHMKPSKTSFFLNKAQRKKKDGGLVLCRFIYLYIYIFCMLFC